MTQTTETVGDLIAGASPRLGELHARAKAFSALAARVRAILPSAEAAHVTGIVQCDKNLVILVDSSQVRYSSKQEVQMDEPISVENLVVHALTRGDRFDLDRLAIGGATARSRR